MAKVSKRMKKRRPGNPRMRQYGKPLPQEQIIKISEELEDGQAQQLWRSTMKCADNSGLAILCDPTPLLEKNKDVWCFEVLDDNLVVEYVKHSAQKKEEGNNWCLAETRKGETKKKKLKKVWNKMKKDLNDSQTELNDKLDREVIADSEYVKKSIDNIFKTRKKKKKQVLIGWAYDHNYSEAGLNDFNKTCGVTGWMRKSVDQEELQKGGYCAGILSNQVILGSAGYTANWHCEHLNLGSINIQNDENGIKISTRVI